MVQFRLLGPLEVNAAGVRVGVGGPRQRAVLARLLIDAGRVVSTDALVDAVWGDDPPPTAVKTLQKYVVELRKALGPDVLHTRGRGYALLVLDDQIDARCFERLVEQADVARRAGEIERAVDLLGDAERLWQGDVLADLADAAFVSPERVRLSELHLAAVETALELQLVRGHHVEVAARAAELVETQPLRERLWSSFVLALYRSGRQVEALRAYERYRNMLAEDLGLEPSEALRGLEVAILRHDPELGASAAASGAGTEGSLPRPRSSLIGRESEVAAVEAALGAHRLVTLTGTAGVGKTRLAVEVATRLGPRHPGGCWFVDLAAVGPPELVVRAVAGVLSIDEQPGEDLLDSLTGALSHRSATLILLDNCEHLLRACAVVADQILLDAPGVTVLATSRQRLGVAGEHVLPVGPLPVQGGEGHVSAALALFVERARQAAPTVQLSADDLDAATRVCERLDGIPLAIELAASQVRALEPAEIAARLDDRLRFEAPSKVSTPRQRTLDAAVGWSYERLSEAARCVFDRLAVFAESCTLEAAEAVATPAVARADVLGAVIELVDASLLVRERGPSSLARYRMLETLRLYGLRQLERSAALSEARRAHTRFYVDLAQSAGPHLFGPAELTWKRRLQAEEPNLRAALAWSGQHDHDLTAQLCIALWSYWSMSWRNREGLTYLTPLLDKRADGGVSPERRAWALTAAATLASETGEARQAGVWAEEALRWFIQAGEERGRVQAQLALGTALANQGALNRAEEVLAEAVSASRAAADQVLLGLAVEAWALVAARRGDHGEARRRHLLEVGIWSEVGSLVGEATGVLLLAQAARSTGDLDAAAELSDRAHKAYVAIENPFAAAHALSTSADVARLRGDDTAAELMYLEALTTFQSNGDRRCLGSTNKNLAVIANQRGDHAPALKLFVDSMRLRHALGDESGLAECLEGIANTMLATDAAEAAVTLLSASSSLRTATGATALPEDLVAFEELTSRARLVLLPELFEQAWATGANLGPADLLEYASELSALGSRPG